MLPRIELACLRFACLPSVCCGVLWSVLLELCPSPACPVVRAPRLPASFPFRACVRLACVPRGMPLVVGLGQLSLPFLCPLCRPVRQSRLSAADWVSRYLTASLQHLRERTLVATRLVLVRLLWMLGCGIEHSVRETQFLFLFFWFWFCFLPLAPSCWASSAVLASAVQRRQRARSRAAQSLACLLPCVKY